MYAHNVFATALMRALALDQEYRQQKSIPEDGISSLFLTGFATSAVCSSIIGPYIDRYGRKAAVVIYCILEVKQCEACVS